MNNIANNNPDILNRVLEMIRTLFKNRIMDEINSNGVHTLEIDGVLNRFDRVKLEQIKDNSIVFEIGKNMKLRKTILSVWENEQEIKL